ncbi:MAG: hypothetical protein AB7Y74_06190 [Syntrophorhabdus sp.]
MANENNINNRYDAIIPKTIFHYTSFEKFKCILQYGTWRFKLSTQSNDLLDTTYIVDIIKKLEIQRNLTDDYRKLLEMLICYFKRDAYERQLCAKCKTMATNWEPTANTLWKASHGCE